MATYTKFNSFVEALAEKVHNLGSDTLMVALSNSDPTASISQLSSVSQISYTNLSNNPTSRQITTTSSSQTGGTYKLILTDLVLTASGGTVGPFRYIIVYNDTATNDELIAYYDYGASGVTLQSGETFTIDFDGTNGFLQLA